jgi:hypothetical protein
MNWANKEDVREYMRQYKKRRRASDPEFLRKYKQERREWYKKKAQSALYRKKQAQRMKIYYSNFPWLKSGQCAKYRCSSPRHELYHRYGGRGIKFMLTKNELKQLWLRDSLNLKDPTLDRIDNDGNYEFSNCRFIERSENSKRQFYSKKTVTA